MATAATVRVAANSGEMPNFESGHSGMSWGAIIAGAVAASALSLILFALGAGLGFSAMSPWAGDGATATAIGVGAGIWFMIVQWLSSAMGGYMAGRLRAKWAAHGSDEVFFRDTAHGFLAWALATMIAVHFFSAIVGGAASLGGQVDSGAAQGASQAAANAAPGAMDSALDSLFRSANPATPAPGGQPANEEDMRAQTSRVLMNGVTGELTPEDRTYLGQMVTARTGLAQPEAEQRVDQVVAEAKETADTARKAAASAALLTALSLLVGAFVGTAAGALGGRHRDLL